ncbi:hypothetical protein ACJZ2D_001427 [Fusarium nematophilum]
MKTGTIGRELLPTQLAFAPEIYRFLAISFSHNPHGFAHNLEPRVSLSVTKLTPSSWDASLPGRKETATPTIRRKLVQHAPSRATLARLVAPIQLGEPDSEAKPTIPSLMKNAVGYGTTAHVKEGHRAVVDSHTLLRLPHSLPQNLSQDDNSWESSWPCTLFRGQRRTAFGFWAPQANRLSMEITKNEKGTTTEEPRNRGPEVLLPTLPWSSAGSEVTSEDRGSWVLFGMGLRL